MDNRQAIGYMLLACKQLDYSKEQARKMLGEMYYMFDLKTEDEAEYQGFEWYNTLEETAEKTVSIKPKQVITPTRKYTTLPADYKSEITKKNEELLRLIRKNKDVDMTFPIVKKKDNLLKKIDKNCD